MDGSGGGDAGGTIGGGLLFLERMPLKEKSIDMPWNGVVAVLVEFGPAEFLVCLD